MKRSILLGASIVFFLLISLTGCEDPIFLTTDTDVMTVFLYDAYTGAPVAATDITSVEITNGGITSAISTTENATGIISTTDNDTSLKFYDFQASETLKILILTTSYIRFESYVTPTATSRFPVYVAILLPSTQVLQSPAYTISITDGAANITDSNGSYLIVPANADLGLGAQFGGTTPTVLTPYLPPNWGGGNDGTGYNGALPPLSGTIPADGDIELPADSLYPGVEYSIYIYDVDGYADLLPSATTIDNTATTITLTLFAN